MRLLWGECHNTSLTVSQYRFREWLGVDRQQAITWANVDLDPCRHMASLGHSELNVTHWSSWVFMESLLCILSSWPRVQSSNDFFSTFNLMDKALCSPHFVSKGWQQNIAHAALLFSSWHVQHLWKSGSLKLYYNKMSHELNWNK